VKYLVEFKKNKISLDFCLAHAFIFIEVRESPKVDFLSAMEKKKEKIINYFNKNTKNDFSSFVLIQKKQKIKRIPMKLLRSILF